MINFSSMNIKIWSRLGSCGAFGQAMLALPEIEDKTVVLTADLCSFSGLERFKASHPDRLYNVGIAEQNMLGIAAGLADEGFVPFVTSYAAFSSLRCADQTKVCMGYMGLPIKLVGLTSGLSCGIMGATHICLEDIAFMRSLPEVVILSPADCTASVKATLAAGTINAPVYLRMTGTMNCPIVYNADFEFEVGKAIKLREGDDISIIATGSMVYYSLQAAQLLAEEGISVEVIDMHTLRPLDLAAINEANEKKLLVTVEEHSHMGGLGGAVAEALAMYKQRAPHLIIGTQGAYPDAADYPALLDMCGLSTTQLAQRILKTYKDVCA